MANIPKTQYESVYSVLRTDKEIVDPLSFFKDTCNTETQLANIAINEEDIVSAINEIAPDAPPGPDGFHHNC